MKRIVSLVLAILAVLFLYGCDSSGEKDAEKEKVMDISGKYVLNEELNEAIIDDFGTVTDTVDGNARVFYQIFVGSFSDSDGDGIGDLRGIINRFDYLNDGDDNSGLSLGVEGIWLTPIFESPSYHKYDVSNYYEIDSDFGNMDDLKDLIKICHERNVKIILDLPINHTSISNLWYTRFLNAHKEDNIDSEYYDYYVYSDRSEPGRTFAQIYSGSDEYYECNFSRDMPELNFDNEAVKKEVVDISRFYLDMGVDGFRFDAAKYIFLSNEGKNAQFWGWYMDELRSIKSDIYTVAEVWDSDSITYPYFASTNCFNFSMSQFSGRIAQTAKAGNVNVFTAYVDKYLDDIEKRNPDAMMISFISNHDMDRAAGYLTYPSGQAKVAANLSILLPGSSFVYYGEEIGMKGSRGSENTDANRRLAMLWGDDDTVSNPVGANYAVEQSNGTVASHKPDGNSLYNHYKKLIAIRKANPEISYGEYTPFNIADSKLGGFISTYEGSTVAVLHNTSLSAVEIDISTITDVEFKVISAYVGVGAAKLEGTTLTIDGQTSVVLK
ncbi:MAG: hypothetical protein IKL36_06415 [Clostridia bacterium]|nr:hypothetical protein [Clostridia bacterium]